MLLTVIFATVKHFVSNQCKSCLWKSIRNDQAMFEKINNMLLGNVKSKFENFFRKNGT